jgi:signal transduction histidine kinase
MIPTLIKIHHITVAAVLLLHLLSCDSSRMNDPEVVNDDAYSADFEILNNALKTGHFDRADSLINVLAEQARQTGDNQLQIRILIEKAGIHQSLRQANSGILLLEGARDLISESGTIRQSIQSTILLSNLYMMDGRSIESLRLVETALDQARQIGNSELIMSALASKAMSLSGIYNYAGALETYIQALDIFEKEGSDPAHKAILMNNIGLNYHNVGNYDEALRNYSIAYELNHQTGNLKELGANLNNMANSLKMLGRYGEAADSLQRAIELEQNVNMNSRMIRYYYNLGMILINAGDYEQAGYYLRAANDVSRNTEFTPGIMYNASGLARLYHETDSLKAARQHSAIALDLAEQSGNLEIKAAMHEVTSQIEEKSGNTAAALAAYKEFHTWSDSLNKLSNSREIEEIRIQKDASLTETENELLRRELAYSSNLNSKQNQFLAILSAGIFVTILLLIITFRSRRKLSHTHEKLTSQAAEISRKNRQLQQLNRDNDTLVSVIVHDLRNPLSGLLGAIELVQMDPETDAGSSELLCLALENGKRLKYQIDELLEVTSIDKKNISGESEVISVQTTVRDVLKIYRHSADKKSIGIDEQLQPLQVNTHKEYLVRIVDNLVSNAIKYSPRGARISVKTSFIGASYWQVEVQDQGPGFNDCDKENLFKLFGRLSGKPTGDEKSTGLGLYTVKMLVDKLNGTVSLISEPGKGSTFICRFPGVADADPVLSSTAGEAVV